MSKKEKQASPLPSEMVKIAKLRPHPENYRSHPESQLEHLRESLREHGVYRNVVVARDGTILAGHGIVEAARHEGLESIEVKRLDLDPSDARALKVLAADNTLGEFASDDEQKLLEILERIRTEDAAGLLGTGHDDEGLARLLKTNEEPVAPDPEMGSGLPAKMQREVTLFFSPEQYAEWGESLRKLAGVHNTDTVSDTVLAVIRAALS